MQPNFYTSSIRDSWNFYRLRLCRLAREMKQQQTMGEHLLVQMSGMDPLSVRRNTQWSAIPTSALLGKSGAPWGDNHQKMSMNPTLTRGSFCRSVWGTAPGRAATSIGLDGWWTQRERDTCGLKHIHIIMLKQEKHPRCLWYGGHQCKDTTCSKWCQKNTP